MMKWGGKNKKRKQAESKRKNDYRGMKTGMMKGEEKTAKKREWAKKNGKNTEK